MATRAPDGKSEADGAVAASAPGWARQRWRREWDSLGTFGASPCGRLRRATAARLSNRVLIYVPPVRQMRESPLAGALAYLAERVAVKLNLCLNPDHPEKVNYTFKF